MILKPTNRVIIKKTILFLLIINTVSAVWGVSDFAVQVVDYSGVFGDYPYNDPNAVLGKPAVRCLNDPEDPWGSPDYDYRVKLVEAAHYLSPLQEQVITTINPGEYIIVKFDHPVVDFPQNPYGRDFIVFGNAFFNVQLPSEQPVGDAFNMNTLLLNNPAGRQFEEIWVSVSQGPGDDPNKIDDPNSWNWYTFENGPWADDLYPTQAYHWDAENAQWTDNEMDFTWPVDPSLDLSAFNGVSAAEAIELYNGSGGGTSFDLKDLPGYDDLAVDPNTGCRWIQYVRLESGSGFSSEVDAVADVAVCGDPMHPFPPGDVTLDCRVNLEDVAVLSENWLECTYHCDR